MYIMLHIIGRNEHTYIRLTVYGKVGELWIHWCSQMVLECKYVTSIAFILQCLPHHQVNMLDQDLLLAFINHGRAH